MNATFLWIQTFFINFPKIKGIFIFIIIDGVIIIIYRMAYIVEKINSFNYSFITNIFVFEKLFFLSLNDILDILRNYILGIRLKLYRLKFTYLLFLNSLTIHVIHATKLIRNVIYIHICLFSRNFFN